jgi:protein SCO1/2
MNRTHRLGLAIVIAAVAAGNVAAQSASDAGEAPDNVRPQFKQLEITEHRGETLPFDAAFTDDQGNAVTLGDYFNGEKPVLLAFVYFRCPMLCTLVLNGMNAAIQDIAWNPGDEYEIIVISFDHTETPKLAELKKRAYVADFDRPGSADGFHFLVGPEQQVRRVSDALGFPFQWSDESEQYEHPSAIFVLTPDGKISKYLYGVYYEPKTVRLSLVEASNRKIGTVGDRILLLCSHYDSTTGRYTASVMKIVNLTAPGAGAALLLSVFLVIRRRKRAEQKAAMETSTNA